MNDAAAPFWETTPLGEMSTEQWESLCDGCGRCCLHKLEDADTGLVYYTDVACHLLDLRSCRCSQYARRQRLVPDCVVLTPDQTGEMTWLPDSCAYRLLDAGRPLPEWHPLKTGSAHSVKKAGISVAGFAVSETEVAEDDVEERIIHWVNGSGSGSSD